MARLPSEVIEKIKATGSESLDFSQTGKKGSDPFSYDVKEMHRKCHSLEQMVD